MKKVLINVLMILFLTVLVCCKSPIQIVEKNNLDIIAGQRIGQYSLSLTKNQLDEIDGAIVDTLHVYYIYTMPNVKIWYDFKKKRTDQICAYNNYSGKFNELIGINDSILNLAKIDKYYYWEDEEVYQFKSVKGISFNIPDEQLDINRKEQTIEYICVYRD